MLPPLNARSVLTLLKPTFKNRLKSSRIWLFRQSPQQACGVLQQMQRLSLRVPPCHLVCSSPRPFAQKTSIDTALCLSLELCSLWCCCKHVFRRCFLLHSHQRSWGGFFSYSCLLVLEICQGGVQVLILQLLCIGV